MRISPGVCGKPPGVCIIPRGVFGIPPVVIRTPPMVCELLNTGCELPWYGCIIRKLNGFGLVLEWLIQWLLRTSPESIGLRMRLVGLYGFEIENKTWIEMIQRARGKPFVVRHGQRHRPVWRPSRRVREAMTTVLSKSKTGRSHYENGDDLPGRMVPPSVILLA